MTKRWLSSVVLSIIGAMFVVGGLFAKHPAVIAAGLVFALASWFIWPYDHRGPSAKPPSNPKQGGGE